METNERTIEAFCAALAGERVRPAGGTAVAVVGAVGASLCEMVCVHAEAAPTAAESSLAAERERLFALADADATVVEALFGEGKADEERLRRRSMGVPLAVAESCLLVLEAAVDVADAVNEPVVADAATAANLVRGALVAAADTVRANAAAAPAEEEGFAADARERVEGVAADGEAAFEAVLARFGTGAADDPMA